MARDRLLLSDVAEGVPATWHRGTLSVIYPVHFLQGCGRHAAPTQLVHPDGSFNVGLDVESVKPNQRGARSPTNGAVQSISNQPSADYSTDQGQTVLVYASASEDRTCNVLKDHPLMWVTWALYLLLTVLLGPYALQAPEATTRSRTLFVLCAMSTADLLAMFYVMQHYGYSEAMSLNIALLAGLFFALVPRIESVFALSLVVAHCVTLLASNYSLGKCTPRVFLFADY